MNKLIILFFLYVGNVHSIELLKNDKAICLEISGIVYDIQDYRRKNKESTIKDAAEHVQKHKELEVYYALAEKIYNDVPFAVPPAAVSIDFNEHCLSTIFEMRKLQLQTKENPDNNQGKSSKLSM